MRPSRFEKKMPEFVATDAIAATAARFSSLSSLMIVSEGMNVANSFWLIPIGAL